MVKLFTCMRNPTIVAAAQTLAHSFAEIVGRAEVKHAGRADIKHARPFRHPDAVRDLARSSARRSQ